MSGRIEGLIARLQARHPRLIDLSLGRMQRVLAALGDPHRHLPPVVHVAGTNGKGSTCAFLRAMGEAAGMRVHVFISPHLVRFNERIRLAGTLVSDSVLEAAVGTVERVNGDEPLSVFETIQAAAFLLFAQTPADLCVLEVGLGGRWDATNVIERPAACAITSISMDHRDFLGDTLGKIAGEKAGIIKQGVPVATGLQPPEALAVIEAEAAAHAAPLLRRDHEWSIAASADGLLWRDDGGALPLPFPSLPGVHQHDNAGIAVAAIRAARLGIGDKAIAAGVARATWPARMQRLHGALAKSLPADWELWLDGGHNEGGGAAIGAHLATWRRLSYACRRRHEEVEGQRRVPRPHPAARRDALGRRGTGAASGDAGRGHRRRFRRHGAEGTDRCRGARGDPAREARARAGLRQPLPRGGGAEGGRNASGITWSNI